MPKIITEREKMLDLMEGCKTGEIDGQLSLGASKAEGYKTITDSNGNIVDYQDVKIAGYASRWGIDRDSEEMMEGAFAEGLKEYKQNAVLCHQHDSRSENAGVGKATAVYEDKKGLWLEGEISNAPSLRDLRFKIIEGIVKGLSVAGRFTMEFGKNFVKIHKVATREVSTCILPAAGKALFEVKSDSDSSASPENMADMDAGDDLKIKIDGEVHEITE